MSQQLTPKQQHWSEILESADNSGLSLVEFAKANQQNAESLYRWRNQLKKNTLETSESVTQFSQVVATVIPPKNHWQYKKKTHILNR